MAVVRVATHHVPTSVRRFASIWNAESLRTALRAPAVMTEDTTTLWPIPARTVESAPRATPGAWWRPAAHLTDHAFPRLPVRQWVLLVPKRLRYFMQRDGAVLSMVLRILATPKPRFPAGHPAKPAVPLPRRGADGQRGAAHWRSRLHSPL